MREYRDIARDAAQQVMQWCGYAIDQQQNSLDWVNGVLSACRHDRNAVAHEVSFSGMRRQWNVLVHFAHRAHESGDHRTAYFVNLLVKLALNSSLR